MRNNWESHEAEQQKEKNQRENSWKILKGRNEKRKKKKITKNEIKRWRNSGIMQSRLRIAKAK